jgi:hypothetical protein
MSTLLERLLGRDARTRPRHDWSRVPAEWVGLRASHMRGVQTIGPSKAQWLGRSLQQSAGSRLSPPLPPGLRPPARDIFRWQAQPRLPGSESSSERRCLPYAWDQGCLPARALPGGRYRLSRSDPIEARPARASAGALRTPTTPESSPCRPGPRHTARSAVQRPQAHRSRGRAGRADLAGQRRIEEAQPVAPDPDFRSRSPPCQDRRQRVIASALRRAVVR